MPQEARPYEAQARNDRIGDQYIFVALTRRRSWSRLSLWASGRRRTRKTARGPGRADHGPPLLQPGPRPMVPTPTAGRPLPSAVDREFGGRVDYGAIVKDFREDGKPGRYGPPELTGAARTVYGRGQASGTYVRARRRNNLTIRTFLRRFTRLSLGFSKKLDNLAASSLYMAHYVFCRPRHATGPPRWRRS